MKCVKCGHDTRLSSEERGRRIKSALATAENVGRPRKADPVKVRTLRMTGYSLSAIAERLKVSKGAVQYALKEKK
jgi:transposase-like protein